MFSPQWSTCSLLLGLVLAAAVGFCGGKWIPMRQSRLQQPMIPRLYVEYNAVSNISGQAPAIKTNEKNRECAPADSVEYRYQQLAELPATPSRDEELLATISKLGETNPLRAIALARAEVNQRLRAQLLEAALCGWGKVEPSAAADWVLSQPMSVSEQASRIASVLKSAVENPDAAIALTAKINHQRPDQARDFGDALIYALSQAGEFKRASDFASHGENGFRTEWLTAAYTSWANYQPRSAAASALLLEDTAARQDALNSVTSSWAQTDPLGLATFVEINLPKSDQRTQVLSNALVFWASENPIEVADWMNAVGGDSEFDSGRAAVATHQEIMKQPSLAISWARSIADENLRSRTLAAVVETWSLSDLSNALAFLHASTDLTQEDRSNLLSSLGK